mgnify:FL=1
MTDFFADAAGAKALRLVFSDQLDAGLARLDAAARSHAEAAGFRGEPGETLLLPDGAPAALIGA